MDLSYKTRKSARSSTRSNSLTFLLLSVLSALVIWSLIVNTTQLQQALAKSHSHGHKARPILTGGNNSSTSAGNLSSGPIVINGGDINSLAYENSALGVLLFYPHDWKVTQPTNSSVKFIAPAPPAPQNSSYNSSGYLELDIMDLQHWSEYAKKHPELRTNSTLPSTTSSGDTEHAVVYSTGVGKDMYKLMKVWVVGNNTNYNQAAYLFTYSANPGTYSALLPSIQKMINSFQIQIFDQ